MRFTKKSVQLVRRNSTVAALLIAGIVGGTLGCRSDRSEFGAEFIPADECYAMVVDSVRTLTVITDTTRATRIDRFTNYALGEIYDATFGKTQCALLAEFFPTRMGLNEFKPAMEATSIKLRLKVRSTYGENPIKISVYLATPQSYSERKKKIANVPHDSLLGEVTADANTKEILLDLPKELGTNIARNLTENAYTIEKLRDVFPGLYIVAERVDVNSNGLMLTFNESETNSGLIISWLNEKNEPLTIDLPVYSFERKCNLIDNDFSKSLVETTMQKSSDEQQAAGVAYLVGDGGTVVSIDFSSFLSEWQSKKPLTIQRALLLIPVDSNNRPGADTLTYGLASYTRQDSDYVPIIDATLSSSTYGGFYDHKRKCYTLNITGYIQQLLHERDCPTTLHILPASSFIGLSRLMVGNCQNAAQPMQLIVSYTKL